MNVFEAVKQSVTTRQAALVYGISVGRNGMVCCPFHDDRHPSMKVDRRFHCFACQAAVSYTHLLTMIIPARWYAGGKGLDAFRDEMLDDIHIKELHDFPIRCV